MRINDHLRRLAQHAPWLVLPLIAVFSAHAQDAQDEVAALFVSDKLIVGMRAGPGEAFARVANLSTGDRLIPLGDERDGYTRVGLSSGVEGWVQSQYLTEDEPAGNRLRQVERATELLEIEKQRLTEVNRALELDQSEAQDVLRRLEANNSSLNAEVKELRAQAAAAQVPQDKLDDLTEQNNGLRQENKLLREHARSLKERRDQWWFAIGGSVAIFSLVLGLIAGRSGSRRQSGPTWR